MTLLSEWNAISARISGLQSASGLYLHTQTPHVSSHDKLIQPLLDNATSIRIEIRGLSERHLSLMCSDAQSAIIKFVEWSPSETATCPTYFGLLEEVISLCSFQAEYTYLLSSHDMAIKRIVERAFLHLSRSLVVDNQLKSRWIEAFGKREEDVERLGGVHLLQHGIWGFKVHAVGERTDLVLNEQLRGEEDIERVSEGLVLTEWKLCKDAKVASAAWDDAFKQAELYGTGCLAATELRDTRYLVLVSMKRVVEPADKIHENINYRHINIAIDPDTPSKEKAKPTGAASCSPTVLEASA